MPINYVYDELGRLVAVVDPSGAAASYAYDAVGNLLSISRQSASLASLIRFSPASGSVGTTVTIYGTGFSATASQNTVSFNGVAAVVTSSSPSVIVTSVPTGATTGTISVTSPAGTATSGTSFTVTTSSAAPTISSFTPTTGPAGTSVTITGTNFDTALVRNRVTVNATPVPVTSATSTSLAISVPSATTSGRISVATPNGKATSSSEFIIPPLPYTAASIDSTTHMTIGETKTVTLNTANKVVLVFFDGAKGQRVSLLAANNALTVGAIYIYGPDGMILNSVGSGIIGANPFLDVRTLPMTGTYTICLSAESSLTGSITLTLYNVPPDPTGTIAIGGSSASVSLSTPGQNAALSFSATAGQKVSLSVSGSTVAQGNVFIRKPDGANQTSGLIFTGGGFIDSTTLPTTGTYMIFIDPTGTNTGGMTLTLNNTADATGTIIIGGSAATITLTAPGQQGRLTFSGSAGQQVSLLGSNNTINPAALVIYNPNGTQLVSMSGLIFNPFFDAQTLPASGTYTIFIDPESTVTGSMTVTLYNAADATGTVTVGGSATSVTMVPGQNGRVTFSGTANQQVTVQVTGNTMILLTVKLLAPDGTVLTSTNSNSGTFSLATQTLSTTGTYTVLIDPSESRNGSVNISVTSP